MGKQIKSLMDIPQGIKFILIIFSTSTTHHPGDQRSKDFPGHGYGEHTETNQEQEIFGFVDKEDLKTELARLYGQDRNRKDLAIFEVKPVVATISFDVTI